jgi:hypothetical protein
VAYLLKARTVEPQKQPLLANGSETIFVSRQRFDKQTTEQCPLLGSRFLISNRRTVFSVRSVLRCYNCGGMEQRVQGSVESQAMERKLGGWSEMAASLGISQLKHRENCKGVCEKKT